MYNNNDSSARTPGEVIREMPFEGSQMSSNPFTTHGAFSWMELMTTDPQAAQEFYRKLFGWEFEPFQDNTMPYTVVKVQGQGVGGIMKMPPNVPENVPPHWGAYITVNDVDATVRQVEELGGGVYVPPRDIPKVGRFAVLRDPQGAAFMVIRYNPSLQ